MATRLTMARLAAIGVLASLTLVSLPTNVGTAEACWCRSNRIDEVVEEAEQVFKFEVTEVVVIDDLNAVAYGDVVEVFKGTVDSRVRVGLNFKKTCIDVLLLDEGLVLGAIGSKGRYKANGVCSGIDADNAVTPLFRPVVQPSDPMPARFIRAESTLGTRVAVLDERLRPTHFGPGLGRVERFAICPGSQKVLELVVGNVEKDAVTVEVRDLATLVVEATHEINKVQREARSFRDFACHDESGTSFSYLFFRSAGAALPGAAVEIWRSSALTQIPADGAIAAAVDIDRSVAHILLRAPDARVEQWDVNQEQLIATFDLLEMNPVDLDVEPESGIVTVLGGPVDRKAKPKARGFLGRVVDGRLEVKRITNAARPQKIEFAGGSLYTVVLIKGEGRSYQKRELDGTLAGDVVVPAHSQIEFAVSGDTLAIRTTHAEYRTFTKHLFTATQRVDGAGPIAALRGDGAGVTVAIGDVPPLLVAEGLIVDGGPLPPSLRPVPESSSRLQLLLAVLAAVAAAAGMAVLWKRRRTPADDGWMA